MTLNVRESLSDRERNKKNQMRESDGIDLESASAAFLAIISLTCSGSVLATVMRSKEQIED